VQGDPASGVVTGAYIEMQTGTARSGAPAGAFARRQQLWVTSLGDDRGLRIFRGSGSDDCSIIDTRTRREAARVKVGHGPKRLLVVRVPAA